MPVAGKTPVGESPEKLNRMKGRNENMKRRFWAGLLSFVMLWSLLPASALATEEDTPKPVTSVTEENASVYIHKSVNEAGNELTLEAYLTNEVTQTVSVKPLDIVLVLDQSGSMADDFNGRTTTKNEARRQYAMKQAVNSFIDKVGEQYSEKGDHRMAIVTFGSKAETWQGWTVVDAAGKSSLKNAVDRLPQNPAGATNVGAGMQAAETLMGSGYAYDADTGRLTNTAIELKAGSYVLSEDLSKAMSAIPGYELVGVRFVETFAESEPDTQAATDDTATTAFSDYRFEIKTSDSAIFVTCINTYEKKEVEPDTYTVTYTDGVNGTAFANQVYTVHAGDKTPAFNGTPTRSGYTFTGWTPALAETVTGNATYTAQWNRNSSGDDSDTYSYVVKKVDAQDGHVLKDAKFGLYVDDKQIATATSGSKGYARFSLDERVYNKLDKNDDLYVMELTAPDGYVKSSRKYDVSVNDFVKNDVIGAEKHAITVTNSRSSTPDRLNDEEHFAYVIGYKDGNVRPYGLISRAETTTIFFRLLKDSVRDGNLLTSNTYTDVTDNYWANTAISTMTGLGIVQGRTATTFDPYAPITRAQFAAICARFDDGKTQGGQTFTDIQGHWAQAYIERAAELGWIKGFEDGTFRPDTYITRAQAMTMINRVLNRIPEDADDLLSNMNVWPDCNPGDWFYLAVQEATNSHDYKHKAGNYETWSSMNKDPDWTRYEN
jgi:uncharacterized repeat protein (TIGR02543 family)